MNGQGKPKNWILFSIVATAVVGVLYGWSQTIRNDGWRELYAPLTHPGSLTVALVILGAYAIVAVRTREWLGGLVPGIIVSWLVGAMVYQYVI